MALDWGVSRLSELLTPEPASPGNQPAKDVWGGWESDESNDDPPDSVPATNGGASGSITARLRAAVAEANDVMSTPGSDALEAKRNLDAMTANIVQDFQPEGRRGRGTTSHHSPPPQQKTVSPLHQELAAYRQTRSRASSPQLVERRARWAPHPRRLVPYMLVQCLTRRRHEDARAPRLGPTSGYKRG